MNDHELDELIARSIAVGASPGPPATDTMIADAEHRLGVRFDDQYRRFLRRCNGIDKIGSFDLYPVDELGVSQRWTSVNTFLAGEYLTYDPTFEMRGDEQIAPEFNPPPPGYVPVLIGNDSNFPTMVVGNFSIADPAASPGEVALCRYEPELLGTFDDALRVLVAEAEGLADG